MWRYLKANVYKEKPLLLALKTEPRKEIKKVEEEMLSQNYERIFFQEQLQSCGFENLNGVNFCTKV